MISEYDKVHNEHTKRIIISEYAEKLGLENDKYIVDPYRTLCFTIYAENPLPARICIEDLPRRFFTCIGLFEPVYYFHDIYQGVFTKDQKEKLDSFLAGPFFRNIKVSGDLTVWKELVYDWETAVEDNEITVPKHNMIKPNYKLLP